MSELVPLAAWAASVGVPPRTARRMADTGRLPAARLDRRGRWVIPAGTAVPAPVTSANGAGARVIPGEVVPDVIPGQTDALAVLAAEVAVIPAAVAEVAVIPAPVAEARAAAGVPGGVRPFLTLDEVAYICGAVISRRSLAAMLRAGELTGYRRGRSGAWLIPTAEVRRLLGI